MFHRWSFTAGNTADCKIYPDGATIGSGGHLTARCPLDVSLSKARRILLGNGVVLDLDLISFHDHLIRSHTHTRHRVAFAAS